MALGRADSQSLFLEQGLSLFRFPFWWYTQGLEEVIAWSWMGLQARVRSLQISLWIRSLFQPMYGVQDLWGRAISVFMRAIVLVGRCFLLVIEAIAYGVLILLWCLWPITAILLLVLHLVS